MKQFKLSPISLVALVIPILISALVLPALFAGSDSTVLSERTVPCFRSANPCPIVYQQPDGSTLTVFLKGDERVRFARTLDDYTILQDAEGWYRYAVKNSRGDLVCSDRAAREPDARPAGDRLFLKRTGKALIFSGAQLAEMAAPLLRAELSSASIAGAAFPSTGTRKVLVLLIGFQDVPFQLGNADFDGLMNQYGFHGTGCFKEYHEDNSFGQLILNSTVLGPYTAANNMAWYGSNRGGWDARPRDMVAEAVDAAEAAGLDFSQFDNDGDGDVDGIMVIHAGYDEAAGAPAESIWSHAWDLGNKARTYDGVTISAYITSPELSGIGGTNISDIGVLAHEFGHNLGLPDAYDTDYEQGGGYAYGTGYYDIMADGGWNNGGFTPANHIAYAKDLLGWQSPILLNGLSTSISLPEAGNNNVSYRINTPTVGEYFLLENRQQTGWDEFIEGHGLLIYHIDGPFIANAGNAVNSNPSHQGIDIEEADGTEDWGVSAAGDPFPGAANNTSFSDSTSPNSKSWSNGNSGVPISNIAESNGVITFDVGSGSGGGDPFIDVSDIAMSALKQGKRYNGRAVISITGSPSGNPIAGATVTVVWSGAVSGSASAVTGANGSVTFDSAKVTSTGPFTVTVSNVSHASMQYDAGLNVESWDSVSY